MLLQDKLLEKYNSVSKLEEFQKKLIRGRLVFGNRISIIKRDIYTFIGDIINNEDNFLECDFCNKKFTALALTLKVDEEYNLCDNCLDEAYGICESCGEFVYRETAHILDENYYCEECYFEEKQKAYHEHTILNPLLKKLQDIITDDIDIFKLEFRIDKNLFSIECYGNGFYRLGSWGANSWVDIGNNKADLLRAIDYNLGDNRDKLDKILIDDNTRVEL